MKYKKHIFICTNTRTGSDRKSCGEVHGLELVKAFKKLIADAGLNIDIDFIFVDKSKIIKIDWDTARSLEEFAEISRLTII